MFMVLIQMHVKPVIKYRCETMIKIRLLPNELSKICMYRQTRACMSVYRYMKVCKYVNIWVYLAILHMYI